MKKSGGVATNIGVHFYDMLHFVFGKVLENKLHYRDEYKAGGYLEYEKARVRWFLSVDVEDIPTAIRDTGKRTYRLLTMNGTEIEFSDGFTDLHTRIYEDVLRGGGFSLEDNRVAIETVGSIRTQEPRMPATDYHPFLHKLKK